jgi:ribulose-5-phosphate 4-epimerase/fuculose-1-phosphate aldolase
VEAVPLSIRAEVLKYARLTAVHGLVPNTQGNVSARDPQTGLIAITPHDHPYEQMTADDLVIIDAEGRQVGGALEPSYETAVHVAVYQARPDIHAIVHTEPVYTNMFGVLGRAIEPVVVSMLVNLGGAVPVMPFMPSGSTAFGRAMVAIMNPGYGVIWANHGLLTAGRTVEEAFRRTVIVENTAQIYHLALLHGQPTVLRREQLAGGVA